MSGTIAIGGVPAGPTNRGWVTLRNAAGDAVRIAVANSAAYSARVVPGSYDLYFTGNSDAYSVTNQNFLLRSGDRERVARVWLLQRRQRRAGGGSAGPATR